MEIEGPIKWKPWKIVCRKEVTDVSNILGDRFVLTIKDQGSGWEVWKARFTVNRNRDFFEKSLVQDKSVS